jgi:tape measure domain-containing protein
MARLKDLKVTIGLSKKGLTKLNGDLRRVKGNFRRNFGEIAALASNAALAIGTTLVAGLTALIRAGAKMETLTVSFRSITGSAKGAARMVDTLNKFAASTPFQLENISSAARQLLAVGVKESDLTKELRMLGDIAAASGSSIEDIAAIFSKVQAKGKVELENLNQLAERGIPIFDQLRQVTGDANMEFGAGSVKIEDFNKALQAMTAEGGFAADSMENLSATTTGLFSTLMDKANIAMAQFSEESGITSYVNGQLGLAIGAVERVTKTTSAEVDNLASSFGDLMSKATEPTLANIEELETGFADLRDNLNSAKKKAKEGTDEYRRLSSMLDEVAAATGRLNDKVLAGSLPAGTTGDTGGDGPTLSDEERKKIFVDQFNAAAALREENIRLAEATHQVVVAAGDEAEALRGVNERMGEMYDLKMNLMTLEEEEPLFDDDEQERIAEGTRLLENAAFAAQHIGQAFSITSQLTEAAFANIKDKSQGFHMAVKAMLEDLLKKAIALAAAFAAIQVITGGAGGAALGGFKGFMMQGMGLGGIPQMAEGGLFTGMSLAMVGEGPGTSLSNPEVVAPLDKLQQMMGGGNVTVTGMIRGQDILISNERSLLDRNRVRGF